MIRRLLASFLAFALCALPAAAQTHAPARAAVRVVVGSPAEAAVPTFIASPAGPTPIAAPIALPTLPALIALPVAAPRARAAAPSILPALTAAPHLDGRALFDGGRALTEPAAPRGAPGKLRTSLVTPRLAADPAPRLAPPRPASKAARRLAFTAGLLGAAVAPVLWGAAPPLFLLYTVLSATALAVVVTGTRSLVRAARGNPAPRPRSKARALLGAALLGIALSVIPQAAAPAIVQESASIVMAEQNVRAVRGDFSDRVAAELAKNPEGLKVLERLTDRGGRLRLPDFYVSKLNDHSSGFSFPVLDAVFVSEDLVKRHGWTVDEFLADPAKQAAFIAAHDELLFHELYHAVQFRAWTYHGQLERFPKQFFRFLSMELEYEAHAADLLYTHEKLRADPKADIDDRAAYEHFLRDLDGYLASLDKLSTYEDFRHVKSARYQRWLAGMRERWPALSAEGKELLAKRDAPAAPAPVRPPAGAHDIVSP